MSGAPRATLLTPPAPAAGAGGAVSEPLRATLFGVGGVEYAVTGRVPRILPAVRPLPGSIDHAGQSYPVADLPAILGGGDGDGESLLLLVEQPAADGDGGPPVRRALVIERLSGIEAIDPAALEPVPAVYPELERRRWRGLLPRSDGRLAVLVDLARVDGGGA